MAKKRHRAKVKPVGGPEEVFIALVESRGLTSAFDRTLARQVTNLLVEGRVLEALRGLEALPPVVRAERAVDAHGDHGAHSAKQRVLALVASAVEADRVELAERAKRGERLTEV